MAPRRKNEKTADSPDSIADWLRGVEVAKCSIVRIRHMQAGQDAASVVATFMIDDDGKFSESDVWEKLYTDAEAFGGFQRYQLLAYSTEGSREPRDRLPIQVDGGSPVGSDIGGTEGPNAAGLTAQAHRHLEATMRMMLSGQSSIVESLVKQLAAKDKLIDELMNERAEVWELMRAMNLAEADKIKTQALVKSNDRKQEAMLEGLKLALPGFINKFLPSKEAGNEAVTRLVESLDDSQRGAIFGLLRPEQAAALMSLLDEKINKEAAKSAPTTEEAK